MLMNDNPKGMWKRTFRIFTQVKIPWFLYLIQICLGILSTKVGLLLVPYTAKVQTADIQGNSVITGYVVYSILSMLSLLFSQIPTMYARGLVSRNVRNRLVGKILNLPMKDFESYQKSTLIARVTNETESVDGVIVSISSFITGLFSTSITFAAMTGYNRNLTILMICIFAYSFFCYWVQGKLTFLGERRLKKSFSIMTQYFAEHMSFFSQIKLMNSDIQEHSMGDAAIEQQYKADLYQTFLIAIMQLFSGTLNQIVTILIFVFGSIYVRQKLLSIQDLVSFYNIALMTLGSVSAFPQLYIQMMQANGTLFYVGKLLASKDEKIARQEGMDRLDEDIVFQDVSFSYDGTGVLDHVSFTIPKGKTTAIVGCNGSGKTTVLKLIERLYSPDSGQICFGPTDAETLHLDEWRQTLGYVMQNTSLMWGTIRDNITYGVTRNVSDEEIKAVSRFAYADEFIQRLPGGYDFHVGESGIKLSAGQRQRIALARCLILDPDYLLLDEATSNLDVYSKEKIKNVIQSTMKERTTICVSHDPDFIKQADQIIVLNDGKVEAIGTHEELLRFSPTYTMLVQPHQERTEK